MGPSAKTSGNPPPREEIGLTVGGECMLHVAGRHFLVKVVELKDDLLRLTFPGRDYPVEGMRGEVQLHDEEGFYYYSILVVEGPVRKGAGILARKLSGLKRSRHRESCRVSTDLMVQVKDEAHVRQYNAMLLNLSAGGAFIQTDAPFDYSTTVELTISLPGEATHGVRCQIVDILPSPESAHSSERRFCLHFVEIEPEAEQSITRYVWELLQQIHPVG